VRCSSRYEFSDETAAKEYSKKKEFSGGKWGTLNTVLINNIFYLTDYMTEMSKDLAIHDINTGLSEGREDFKYYFSKPEEYCPNLIDE